jgi:DNA primase
VIASIRDEALRPAYVRELAGWVNLPPGEVSRITNEAIKQKRASDVAGMRTDRNQPVVPPQDAIPEGDSESASTQNSVQTFAPVDLRDPINIVERQTLEVLIQCPQAFNQAQLQRIALAGMSAPAHNAILSALIPALSVEADTWLGRVEKVVNPVLLGELRGIAARELPVANQAQLDAYAIGVIKKAMERTLAREKAELLAKLRRTDANLMPEEHRLVQQQLMALENERRQLMEV